MSSSLNALKGGYVGDCIGFRVYGLDSLKGGLKRALYGGGL